MWIYSPGEFALAFAIVFAGSFVRGVTGFGSGLIMVPLLALLWGPAEALATMVGLGTINALQLFPSVARVANWKTISPMMIVGVAMTPLGTLLHVSLDPSVVKKIIAALVLVVTLISLRGWTYRGPTGAVPSSIAGGITGLINGIAGVGGPATVLYLMSLPGKVDEHRANIVLAMSLTTMTVLVSMIFAGVVGQRVLIHIAVFFVPTVAGIWAGAKAFHLMPAHLFRLVVLWFLIAVSVAILLA